MGHALYFIRYHLETVSLLGEKNKIKFNLEIKKPNRYYNNLNITILTIITTTRDHRKRRFWKMIIFTLYFEPLKVKI